MKSKVKAAKSKSFKSSKKKPGIVAPQAVIQQIDFKVRLFKRTFIVPTMLIGDVAVYNDSPYLSLSSDKYSKVEAKLDALIADHLNVDIMIQSASIAA